MVKTKKRSGQSSIDSLNKELVDYARSYKGKLKYSFGAKNIVSRYGDCSGFSQHVFLNITGLDIGDGTSTQSQQVRSYIRRWHILGTSFSSKTFTDMAYHTLAL